MQDVRRRVDDGRQALVAPQRHVDVVVDDAVVEDVAALDEVAADVRLAEARIRLDDDGLGAPAPKVDRVLNVALQANDFVYDPTRGLIVFRAK